MATASNVNNKYIAALEATYGETPAPFTEVSFGYIDSVSIDEDENTEKVRGINSGHTASIFEDGLYLCNVTINGFATKTSLPTIMEFFLGSRADSTDYTITSTNETSKTYSFKTKFDSGDVILCNGLSAKTFKITSAKGEKIAYTVECLAKKATKVTETLTVTKPTEEIYMSLDATVTIGGNSFVLSSFNLNGTWNVSDDEGRGIEAVSAGERRLIQRVYKHMLDITGDYEMESDSNTSVGYADERTDEAVIFTLSRGTDNEHVFTMSNTRSFNRKTERTNENSVAMTSADFEALDLGVTGDL